MHRVSLSFENMPERHAELAWRFGEPDECQEGERSRWTLWSPLSPEAGADAHLAWAAECLGPHESFVGELVSLRGKVVLRLDCTAAPTKKVIAFDARRLLPMAHAGVLIELRLSSVEAAKG